MPGNIMRRGKHYYYDFMIDGKRYKDRKRVFKKKYDQLLKMY